MPSSDIPPSLARHLDRLNADEPGAVNDLIAHCQDRFKRLTRQMMRRFPDVQRWEETSDVFHNVVLRLTSALRVLTFDSPEDFLRLAACHIRRELIDLARLRRPALVVGPVGSESGPELVVDKPDSTNDPYNLAQWEELHSRIAALSDDDRKLFDLIYYQGLPQNEAADLLGVPYRSLKRAWQHARIRLIQSLGNESPF